MFEIPHQTYADTPTIMEKRIAMKHFLEDMYSIENYHAVLKLFAPNQDPEAFYIFPFSVACAYLIVSIVAF